MPTPVTRYIKSGDVNIAYQVVGDGPHDLLMAPGWVSNIEVFWESPAAVHFLTKLASFARLIIFDKRGTGLSDRHVPVPDLETRMEDLHAVLDAVGSEKAALYGISEGGAMCCLYSAIYPERVSGLILNGCFARRAYAPDYPLGVQPEEFQQMIQAMEKDWGGPVFMEMIFPSMANDPAAMSWWAKFLRMGASPAASTAINKMNMEIDIRHILPSIRMPTLVLHSQGDQVVSYGQGQYLAEHIPDAKFSLLPGKDHLPWGSDSNLIISEIEEFLTGQRHDHQQDRILSTLLFTDIVSSTEKAAEMGDQRWSKLLEEHNALVRRELKAFRGMEVDTAGDGFLATFDGPARAIRCANAIRDSVRGLGLEIRAGLHTGECEVSGSNIRGIAVHIGARVSSQAGAGEVLVSSTVKDLVAGSEISFHSLGAHTLKGVPGEWQLYRVIA